MNAPTGAVDTEENWREDYEKAKTEFDSGLSDWPSKEDFLAEWGSGVFPYGLFEVRKTVTEDEKAEWGKWMGVDSNEI